MKQRYVFVLADESGNVKEPAANIAAKVMNAQTSVTKPAKKVKKTAPLLKESAPKEDSAIGSLTNTIVEGVASIGIDKAAAAGLGAVGTLLGPIGTTVGAFIGSQTSNIIKLLD